MKSEQKRFRFFNPTHWFYVVLVCFWVLPSVAFAENRIEAERQNWEVFTSRGIVQALLLSDDGKTVWAGTIGGLEKHDAVTGKLIKLFTNLDGLPDNIISSILSDGRGGLWIATNGGLARFKADGSWDVFRREDLGSPEYLLSDGNGGLWIGTDGLPGGDEPLIHLKSDGKREIFNKENSELLTDSISSLVSDGNGGIWIGYSGLAHLKSDGTWEIFNQQNSGLPNNDVNALLSDGSCGVWIGTGYGGLAHLKADGSWEVFNKDNSGFPEDSQSPDNNKDIYSLSPDGNDGLWVGTFGTYGSGGLFHFKADGSWEEFNKENSELPNNNVISLLSYNGWLWIGTWGGGLARLKSDNTWEVFNKNNLELPNNGVFSLLSDGDGGLWIGTWWRGLVHFKSDGTSDDIFKNHHPLMVDSREVFLYPSVTALLSDGKGGLWIGTGDDDEGTQGRGMWIGENWGNLVHLRNDGRWEEFNDDNSIFPNTYVESLLSDGDGGLWIGTRNGGLLHFKADDAWEVFNKDNTDLPAYTTALINSLLSDGDNGLWIGTNWGTITHLESDGTWEVFNRENSKLPSLSITSLLSDDNGGLWIGTEYSGLIHFKSDETWEVFNKDNSEFLDDWSWTGNSLLSDGSGGLWIGTRNAGLVHFKSDTTVEVFNKENSGLPCPYDWVLSLLSDSSGGLWIGTDNGGLAHFLQLGTPEQIIKPDSSDITINWFLNSSSFDYQNVKYIELQRSLSKDGVYETVLDASDKPVRFYADYSICPKPRVDGCWVTVEGHTPKTRTNPDGSTTKGYTLNTPITDPEWLEGLPRYYRLSAVIEEDGKLVRVANNSEAALITPQVEEKPRVELTLDKNAIAMQPNTKAEITVFVSSLDLFRGNVTLEIESATGNAVSNNINAKLEPSTVSLKSGETKPVLLTINALSESTQTIKIIPKIQSGYSGKSASLNVQVGDGTNSMIALSIAHKTKRSRVLDSLTISGC